MITNWAEYFSCFPYLPSAILCQFYELTRTLKLTTRAFLPLALRVKTSILSVRFFTKMATLNHGVILNQKTTLKAS